MKKAAVRKRFDSEEANEAEAPGQGSLLSDQAYKLIKRDIIQCQLRPGAEISEAALTKIYNFGKAPIRAALLMLSQDNLISSMPRRGYIVTPITIKDVQELYELRMILEPAAAKRATQRCDIKMLKSLCKRLSYTGGKTGNFEFLEAHYEFHVAIAKASGNERITRIVSSLLEDMARVIHFGEFAPGRNADELDMDQKVQQKQHEAIVEALMAGNGDVVEKVMRAHIEHSLEMVREAAFASKSLVRL